MAKSKSRTARFDEAQGLIESAKTEIEELAAELQNWHDNIPENLQGGLKADALQSAISDLESVIASLEDATAITPEFPGMCT